MGKKLELNKIHKISWEKGFSSLDDGSIDLIITSPPYNLGGRFHTGNAVYKAYNTYNDNIPEKEYQQNQIDFLNACYDKLEENGSLFYNHKPRIKNGVCTHPLDWILQSKFILKQEIVWRNGGQNFDKIRFYPLTERVYWLVKNPKTKLHNALGLSDIWEFKNRKRHKIHKATFPIELPKSIISCFPNAKTILDPYMGVGTTAKAVIELNKQDGGNRDFLGFEIDELYINDFYKEITEDNKLIDNN